MRKGSDIVSKPVVAFDTGEQFYRVHDLIFDQENNQLLGFLVDEGGWFSSAKVLPLQNVQTIGPDAIIVQSKNTVVSAEQMPQIKRILERNNVLKGTKMMTTDGRDLGTLSDLYFDERSGVVEGYEVSGGLFADAYTGRAFVPAPQTLKIGEDVAFVPPETALLMEEQVGGIKAAVGSAGDALETATTNATASLTNAAVDPAAQKAYAVGRTVDRNVEAPDGTLLVARGQQVTPLAADEAERQGILHALYLAAGGSVAAGLVNRAGNAVAGTTLEQARGRRVLRAVRTDEGLIIAAPSQIVTEPVINRARMYHKEQELLDAVGLSSREADRAYTGERQETQSQASAGPANLWDRLKSKMSDFQEQGSQEAEEHRIKRALGRPTNRVILDPQDNVILNVGEIITHKAVTEARQAGVLDILLSSVYDKDPEITTDEMRAPEHGDASLEQRQLNANR